MISENVKAIHKAYYPHFPANYVLNLILPNEVGLMTRIAVELWCVTSYSSFFIQRK